MSIRLVEQRRDGWLLHGYDGREASMVMAGGVCQLTLTSPTHGEGTFRGDDYGCKVIALHFCQGYDVAEPTVHWKPRSVGRAPAKRRRNSAA